MVTTGWSVGGPEPATWDLSEEVQDLRAATERFVRDRLEPLLRQPPDLSVWLETVRLAATLDVGRMILPEADGGMNISRHDLALIMEQFGAGPLERAVLLSLSSPALMTLRDCEALDRLPDQDVSHYFDGTTSIAPGIVDVDGAGAWVLRQHRSSPFMTIQERDGHIRLVIATVNADSPYPGNTAVVLSDGLCLEHHDLAVDKAHVVTVPSITGKSPHDPARQWLIDVALYLGALLCGAMRQSARFALSYCASRQSFHKPLASHQLVATRIADLVTAARASHLFLRSAAMLDADMQVVTVGQMACHIATEALDASRELVQLCGGHGYVEGLPPAARFQTMHWFAMLLSRIGRSLTATAPARAETENPHEQPRPGPRP
ncbi:acyl-CoA dehydrogenase family protein [Paraburkholderia tropica]|uniref:acyl-CoA dehydrogenase family protein n=1 Tax=Paraburkholderia tropica TaxID=92647 RepID=UPI003017EEA6